MFVFSLKTTPRGLGGMLVVLLLTLTLLGGALLLPEADVQTTAVAVDTDDARLSYLRSLGFSADPTPLAIEEVRIPEEADAAFSAYNALQQQAGFDLTGYAGQRVKCFSYRVEAEDGTAATAHLYVFRGKLIGGDISPADGSAMLPLQRQQRD